MLNGCQQRVIGLEWGDLDRSWNVFTLEHLLVALFSGWNALGVHANQMNAAIQCKTHLESCKLIFWNAGLWFLLVVSRVEDPARLGPQRGVSGL